MKIYPQRNLHILVFCIFCHLIGYSQTINTFAGNGINGFSGDGGAALLAQMAMTDGVAVDAAGNVFISDQFNNRIRKINTSGIITTIAGTGIYGYSGDGGAANLANIASPLDLEVDASGNIYFCDYNNSRIRKISAAGIISTIAGTGVPGFSGDGGLATAAQINLPEGLSLDANGNIYIADRGNNRIRKISTTGIISTIAGTSVPGFSGDGGLATAAQMNYPVDVEVDANGNIYICDANNHRIRKISTSNIITTVAGTGIAGYSGDGTAATSAKVNTPEGLAINSIGEIYIADRENNRIRKINNSGIISTIAGTGVAGFAGDGGPATLALLDFPRRIAIAGNGKIFICDGDNYRIRSISDCSNTASTINITACNTYTSPSGNYIWTMSGTYNDVIPNINGCDSLITFNLVINSTNAPTAAATQAFCNSAIVADLSATGNAIQWYTAASGGSPLVGSTALVNGATYYASQTVSTCESVNRFAVNVVINSTNAPTAPATQAFCNSAIVSDLSATGNAIQWYTAASGGSPLVGSTALVNGTTYYASQTVSTCESVNRFAVNVVINSTNAPIAAATQAFCNSAIVSDLSATGNAIQWYTAASGGSPLVGSTALVNGATYYASQTVSTCESVNRFAVNVVINNVSDITTSTSGVSITSNNANASYIWLDCNNNYSVIQGATTQTFTAATNGNYAVQLTQSGCIDTSECVAINTIGLETIFDENALLIFPNPTVGIFKIDLGRIENEIIISISDINGRIISQDFYHGKQIIELTVIGTSGVYFVNVNTGSEKSVLKLIKN